MAAALQRVTERRLCYLATLFAEMRFDAGVNRDRRVRNYVIVNPGVWGIS